MKASDKYSITIEKLIEVVHTYTDPIRIRVVMGDAWKDCPETKRMREWNLVDCLGGVDEDGKKRLLKYYKNVPVWNLCVWVDGECSSGIGRLYRAGIKAHCYYRDIREGWLAEQADIKRAKQKAYREKRKTSLKGGEQE